VEGSRPDQPQGPQRVGGLIAPAGLPISSRTLKFIQLVFETAPLDLDLAPADRIYFGNA
jgi:hypothetical protein